MKYLNLSAQFLLIMTKRTKAYPKTDEHASNLGEKFVSGVKTAGAWGAAITGAATAAVAGVVKLTTESATSMDTIDKMSQKIGVSKEAYQGA